MGAISICHLTISLIPYVMIYWMMDLAKKDYYPLGRFSLLQTNQRGWNSDIFWIQSVSQSSHPMQSRLNPNLISISAVPRFLGTSILPGNSGKLRWCSLASYKISQLYRIFACFKNPFVRVFSHSAEPSRRSVTTHAYMVQYHNGRSPEHICNVSYGFRIYPCISDLYCYYCSNAPVSWQ